VRVRINPIRCTGHGTCAARSSHVFGLDQWGFAFVLAEFQDTDLPEDLEQEACAAATQCPEGAIDTVGGPRRWAEGPLLPRSLPTAR
jgi:ferredoxin